MSSFLMNSYPGVDPKFPPPDADYGQSPYMAAADFYQPAAPQGQYYGAGAAAPQPQYQPYQSYYPVHHHHHAPPPPQQQQHLYHPQGPPPAPAPPHVLPPAGDVSPHVAAHASPADSPSTTAGDQHSTLGDYVGDDSCPELDDDDDDSDDTSDRVIYPWMKKIHVAGVGKPSSEEPIFFSFESFYD